MTNSVDHTHRKQTVPPDRKDSGTYRGPKHISVVDRKEIRREIEDYETGDYLAHIWNAAPLGTSHAFVQFVIGAIKHNVALDQCSNVESIMSFIPDGVLDELPPITKIEHGQTKEIIQIGRYGTRYSVPEDFATDGTKVVLGPVADQLSARIGDLSPEFVADATQSLVEDGDQEELESLFCSDATAQPPSPERTTGGRSRHAAAEGGPRGIDVKYSDFTDLFTTPPFSRLSAYRGRFQVDIEAISARNHRGNQRNHRGNSSRSARSLEDLGVEKEQELLDRSPLGEVPRRAFSQEAYDEIVRWRPIIEEAEPLAAVLQLILTSDLRDDDAEIEQPCTGIPLWHELILAAFGFTSRQHARDEMRVNTTQLMGLFRKHVDSDFHVSRCHPGRGRARILLAHSIPHSIIQIVEETMFTADPDKDVRLIGGDQVKARGNYNAQLYKERVKDVEEKEPEIPLPEYTQKMQEYLNHYRTKDFSGQWGFLMNLEEGFDVAHEISDAKRRRQMIRRLSVIEDHPMPLYFGCDFFPRLAAEKYNQLMNMPAKVLRAMYVPGRDVEQDLSKAHLACTAPLAERNGIEAGVLREYLNRGLEEDYDLWADIASHFDVDNMEAARKVAKNLYGTPYGSSEQNVLRNFCFDYAGATGTQHGFGPFEGAMDHPLVDELFRIREGLREVIQDRGYLLDAAGREIRPEMMTHKGEGAWKSVLAYTNASFEQKLMWSVFREAIETKKWASEKSHRRPKFRIWLYQADGVTIRIGSKASGDKVTTRLQDAVAKKADELDIPTKLELDYEA